MNRIFAKSLGVLASLVVLWAATNVSLTFAQSIQGSITGTVTDPTGAVIPNVTVSATNDRTNFTRTTVTNEVGLYEFPNLDPSEYTIKAQATGFKTYTNRGIPLAIREGLRVDIQLEVGTVTQEVTVQGQAAVVRTEDAKLELTLNERYWDMKPSSSAHGIGMDGLEAAIHAPGVYYTRLFGEEGTAMMVTGSRSTETLITVNGVKQTSYGPYSLPYSSVQEVKIERVNSPAEYSTPGTVEMTMRGGSGSYHAAMFYDMKNRKFSSSSFFSPRPTVGSPDYSMAYTGGGPVYIPKAVHRERQNVLPHILRAEQADQLHCAAFFQLSHPGYACRRL